MGTHEPGMCQENTWGGVRVCVRVRVRVRHKNVILCDSAMLYLRDLILSAQIMPGCWYVFTSDEIQVETCVLLLQTINTNKQTKPQPVKAKPRPRIGLTSKLTY